MEKKKTGIRLDIVFVVGATVGTSAFVNQIKGQARGLADVIARGMERDAASLSRLRVRVIDFADYATEYFNAINMTEFFDLPAENDRFARAVNEIDCERRGGDLPDNGLEALYIAFKSDWMPVGNADKGKYVTRHVIVLMSDTVPLDFGERDGCFGYDASDFPYTVEEFEKEWSASERDAYSSISPLYKRLFLFVPEGEDNAGHSWKQVAGFEKTQLFPVKLRGGLKDLSFDKVISTLLKRL